MRDSQKIRYNVFLGLASEALSIVMGIIIPRLILTSFGSEINGLLSSVTQIYSYVALLEAGVGVATVQALFKSIAENDRAQTNAVMAATNHYYHKTGLLYLVAIIAFSTLYPLIVATEIPVITVILIIILNGVGNVINYFFQAKYFLLLQAEGKNYVRTSLNMATNVFKNVAKIVLLACGCDVVLVQMIAMIISLIQMAYMSWYIKKYYSWIDLSVEPNFKAISQSKNVLVHQVSGLIYNNTDAITLSVFCGLRTVSVYAMYTLLFGMISTALSTISSSFLFKLGQMFHKDKARFMIYYDLYEVYYMALVFSLYSVAYYFILPFMRLYTKGVTDINYIDPKLPLLFIATYLMSCGRSAPCQAITFAGHFKNTQNRSILEAAINLVVSVVAVQYLGIYGVLIGTIAALLYRSNDMIVYANKYILHRRVWITYRRWLINLLVFMAVLGINRLLVFNLDSYVKLLLVCVPYTILCLTLFFAVISLCERDSSRVLLNGIKVKFFK